MFVCFSPQCFSTYWCCIMCITRLPPDVFLQQSPKDADSPVRCMKKTSSCIVHFGKAHGRWKRDIPSLIYTVHTYVHPRAVYITCPCAHTPVLTHAELLAEAVTIQTKQAGLRLKSSWGIWRESCRWQVWKKKIKNRGQNRSSRGGDTLQGFFRHFSVLYFPCDGRSFLYRLNFKDLPLY